MSFWDRSLGSKGIVQGASAVLSGTIQAWSGLFDVSPSTHTSTEPTGGMSADGTVALVGWNEYFGKLNYIIRARVAEFVQLTPTPTPVATNTPTPTPTPPPTATPVGTLSAQVLPPTSSSNDHYVVLLVRDRLFDMRRAYFGYLIRASDNKVVRSGKFKLRSRQGSLVFHDVPPGVYRSFTLVVRSRGPRDEIDPLECPKCKAQMRIIAFIQDEHSIKDIMKSQGIPDFQAPPPIPRFIDTALAMVRQAHHTAGYLSLP